MKRYLSSGSTTYKSDSHVPVPSLAEPNPTETSKEALIKSLMEDSWHRDWIISNSNRQRSQKSDPSGKG